MRHFVKWLVVVPVIIMSACSGVNPALQPTATPAAALPAPAATLSAALAPQSGAAPLNLTQSVFPEVLSPAWSPDGQRIAFVAADPTQGNHREVFVINRDGTGLVRLSHADGNNILPTWSADGQQILYTYQYPDGENAEIFTLSADGADLQQLTKNAAYDWDAIWSPIGNKIAFLSNRDGNDALYVMDPDGSNPVRLTDLSTNVSSPAWSPDGSSLVFSAPSGDSTTSDLYAVDLSGSGPVQLTNGPGYKGGPQWSPDGKKILYSTEDAIYTIGSDGSDQNQVASNPTVNFAVWSPDGSMIAFQADQSGDHAIFVVNADGKNLRYFPHTGKDDLSPGWSPDGTQLAFLSHTRGDARTDILLVALDSFGALP